MRARSILILAGGVLLAGGAGSNPGAEEIQPRLPGWIVDQIVQRDDAISVARMLRMPELRGKPLPEAGASERDGRASSPRPRGEWGPRGAQPTAPTRSETRILEHRRPRNRIPRTLRDSAISALPDLDERRPSVATRSRDPKTVVTAYVASPFTQDLLTRCLVKRSGDRGRTWSEPVVLPMADPSSNCLHPSIVWSADGHRLFAVYRSVTSSTIDLNAPPGFTRYRSQRDDDVFVSQSRNAGRTWSTPRVALKGDPWGVTVTCRAGTNECEVDEIDPGTSYTWPGLALSAGTCGRRWVYVTATREVALETSAAPIAIAFTRAYGRATRWSPPVLLDTGTAASTGSREVSVQGSKPAAAPGAGVLVAWYHSGADGFLEGDFEIRTAYSKDHGATWSAPVVAATDGEEANFWLGPDNYYKQWWTTMYPDVAVDAGGRAHIVYTHDPDREDLTAEEGDIRYIASACRPYADWSLPETVNDDGEDRAQGFPTIAVRHRGHSSIVDVAWEDTRLSPEVVVPVPFDSSNLYYDIFHARRVPGHGACWSANDRVSDESSIQALLGSSERSGLAASDALLYSAWTDRRNDDSVSDTNVDVYGSRILPERGRR